MITQIYATGEVAIPTAKDGLHKKPTLMWDSLGIINYELMPTGQSITEDYYSFASSDHD